MMINTMPPPETIEVPIKIRHLPMTLNPEFNRYTPFTFPQISYEQLSKKGVKQAILSSATLEGKLVGLAISLRQAPSTLQLVSFYVVEKYRNTRIGTKLMDDLLNTCRSSSNDKIELTYKTFWENNSAWEQLLIASEWCIKQTDNLYIRLENGQDLKSISQLADINLPPHCDITHLTDKKLQQLIAWSNNIHTEHIPADVHPAKNLNTLNESCSLLLMVNQNVAGWIIGQQIDAVKLQISSLYVLPQFRKEGENLGSVLIAEAIKRNRHVGLTFFGMRRDNKFMQQFLQLISGTYSIHEKKKAWITL